jgi:hypothetical protein
MLQSQQLRLKAGPSVRASSAWTERSGLPFRVAAPWAISWKIIAIFARLRYG